MTNSTGIPPDKYLSTMSAIGVAICVGFSGIWVCPVEFRVECRVEFRVELPFPPSLRPGHLVERLLERYAGALIASAVDRSEWLGEWRS